VNLMVMSVVENHLSESGTLGATKYSGMGGDSETQPFLLHKSKIAKQALDINRSESPKVFESPLYGARVNLMG
jgi:hypothetical protein